MEICQKLKPQGLHPNKPSFISKKSTQSTIGEHGPPGLPLAMPLPYLCYLFVNLLKTLTFLTPILSSFYNSYNDAILILKLVYYGVSQNEFSKYVSCWTVIIPVECLRTQMTMSWH